MKHKTQDPKFYIENNRLVGQSGPIPGDEPIFILRGRDVAAIATLCEYQKRAAYSGADREHLTAINMCIADFRNFSIDHNDRMKVPDTDLSRYHDGKPEAKE